MTKETLMLSKDERYVKNLELHFPTVKVKPNENLDINFHQTNAFKKVWYNKRKYPNMTKVAQTLGICERSVLRLSKRYECFSRRLLDK